MATPRRRDLIRRRRRVEDDGEDDASVATEHLDDSQSEASLPSDAEEDADADYSDLSDTEATGSSTAPGAPSKANGFSRTTHHQSTTALAVREASPPTKSEPAFTTSTDTEVMMNGLKISGTTVSDEAVEFDAMTGDDLSIPTASMPVRPASSNGRRETPAERRRRENEEYRKRKEEDPAFIPNRGPFFMHDQRHAAAGHAGIRQPWRGRGRGRPPVGGPFSPANLQAQAEEAANGTWAHDLHETLLEPEAKAFPQHIPQGPMAPYNPPNAMQNPPMPKPAGSSPNPAPVRSFSTTRETAKALVRVFLPGMKIPVTFPDVPLRLYARLPNHRPPLRRDKPVRISLPDQPPRYIFPSTDRSFIFIPRAMRPNQHGFGRGRGRGGFGSFGGYSSRRTSVYGGSVYSPSVAMSRRSSLAREYGRDGLISPAGSVISRGPAGPVEVAKPVVRLPPGAHQHPGVGTPTQPHLSSGGGTPVVNLPQPHSYPLPQRPALRENYSATALPMHQPRPQKAVSVAGIESPESIPFQPPQPQEQQPFHQQVPLHLNNSSTDPSTFFPHQRQLSYPNQPTTGTPLSNIPERAIHAQPFQPFQPQMYQPGFPTQPGFFYPNGVQAPYPMGAPPPGSMVPVFVQPNGQQVPYVVPSVAANLSPSAASANQQQNSMVAHETNGMVYYYDPNQLYAAPPVEGYAAPGYTVPGMGGMMTPSPDGYYYPQVAPAGTVYYQPQ